MSTERKYAIMFPVHPRTEKIFSNDEIETAAKIALLENLPVGCSLAEEPDWEIQWSENYIATETTKLIRIAAKVSM